ncbi:MAG TPA: glycosyltransferase [Mycobacteriales bacterium]|nr:glycosyltransferase [Mycobacteriales bacterium]
MFCIKPLFAGTPEDRGDGKTEVLIPNYVKTPTYRPRTWVFMGISVVVAVLMTGWRDPQPLGVYRSVVQRLVFMVTGEHSVSAGYSNAIQASSQFFAVATLLGMAVVVRATPGRRALILAHIPAYLVMTALAQTLLIAIGMGTDWPIGPYGIEATLLNLLIGGVVTLRATFTTFILPGPTSVPNRRPIWIWDSIITLCCLLIGGVVVVGAYALIARHDMATSTWQVFVPLYAMSLYYVVSFVPLFIMYKLNGKPPGPTAERPPVDVIVPAYNEEENLARLMRSLDVAARKYGGPVRVVISNDGSTDSTEQIARAEIEKFRYARGEVLNGKNGKQARALNRAIAVTESDIIVRIDADCVMGEDALVYAITWFQDPEIGCVGAGMMPRTDTVTWFHRMRAMETLFQFRFARPAQNVVDGVNCIPGTFTAFRRAPAVESGGFPSGMNGEDTDLTMNIGRLGYRSVVDPRVRSYEDVPRSLGEFLEQRTRWSRAGIHVFARHSLFRSGSGGPRVWYWTLRRGFMWFSMEVGLISPLLALQLAISHPSYRQGLLSFLILKMIAAALPLAISIPLAVKAGLWKNVLWLPTWFIFAFVRKIAALESFISLPTRPVPAVAEVLNLSTARRTTRSVPELSGSAVGS